MSLTLVIGNKNYSSWSLRPWLMLKMMGVPFEEVLIPIYMEGSREQILEYSPAGKVPFLRHDQIDVWDSLAITEYLAETYPQHGVWPEGREARALARSVCAEMHSGFVPLRKTMTMNVRRRVEGFEIAPDVAENVARVEEIWLDARGRFGSEGPFLFGRFTAADAFFAPVVTRFETYDVRVSAESRSYMDAVLALPPMREWMRDAAEEPWTLPQFEV
jgi:glutathione S-transferase